MMPVLNYRKSSFRSAWQNATLWVAIFGLLAGMFFLPALTQAQLTPQDPATPPAEVLAPPIPPAPASVPNKPLLPPHQKAALIYLGGPVDDIMLRSIQRRVDLARRQECDLIIYEIDTYGGQVTSALEIARYTRALAKDIPVVAYVHSKAISAGVIIAAACQHIIVAQDSAIGDCEPIAIENGVPRGLDDGLRAKISSPILEDLRESAQRNRYPYLILEAMVVREIELWTISNNLNANTPPLLVDGREKDKILKEKNRLPDGTIGNVWILDPKPMDDGKSLLTLTSTDAVKYGLARAEVDSEAELRALLNLRGDLVPMDFTWSEEFVRWLSQTEIRTGLFVLMLVLAYLEFSHPGISVAGIGAVICLTLLIGAPYMTGLAQIWQIILIGTGAAVIIFDLLLYGGIGLLAVPGFILLAIGLVASFIPADPGGGWNPANHPAQWYSGLQNGLAAIIFGSCGALAIFYFLSRYLYLTPGFKRLQLAPNVPVSTQPDMVDALDKPIHDAVFVGALGITVTMLRTAGKVRFDDHIVDAVSEGQFIPEGVPVTVSEISGSLIVVKPAAPSRPLTPSENA